MENKEFKIFGGISAIYGLIFVFCLYKSTSGVTNILWMISTVAFMLYIVKKIGKTWKFINTFISIVLVLLGISNAVTGDVEIIFFNYVVIMILVGTNILFLYDGTVEKAVFKSIGKLLEAAMKIIGNFGKPFSHLLQYIKSSKSNKSEKMKYVIIGIVCAIPVVIFVIFVLASADGVFREGFEQIFEIESIVVNFIGIALVFFIGYMVSYSVVLYLKRDEVTIENNGKKIVALPIIMIVSMVTVVYVIFSAVQIIYLFTGKGTLPSGYTYAEYAREGFFQLLFLSIVNVIAVLICMECVEKSKGLKIVLFPLCLCTVIMALSSAYRMKMYINEYGLTAMRIYVLWALFVIIAIIMGMLLKLIFAKINLFQYCVVICSICFLILSFGHKDYYIAKYNFDKYNKMAKIERIMDSENEERESEDLYEYVDMEYLMKLSTDAAPVMTRYEKEVKGYMELRGRQWKDFDWCYIEWEDSGETYNHMGIRNFNLSRWYSGKCVNKMRNSKL